MSINFPVKLFQTKIFKWYRVHGRHELPWRKSHSPYRILVSEIMLQQTQVCRVIPKYKSFLKKFPTIKKLAEAPLLAVLKEWRGLGYNRRAVYLKRTAEIILREHKGIFPKEAETLLKFPGIVFAWNEPDVLIETNIRRVYIHFFFRNHEKISDSKLKKVIERTTQRANPRIWYWALMDYGAAALKSVPNPNRKSRHYAKQKPFSGSRRQARSKVLGYMMKKEGGARLPLIKRILNSDRKLQKYSLQARSILEELGSEGFLVSRKGLWRVSEN